jgi:ribosomal protein S18 acetylase RimI-like enzyme
VIVREAVPEDFRRCAEIDSSFFATHVWQMEELRPDPFAGTNEEIMIVFREVRLPRPRSMARAFEPRHLVESLQASDVVFVAEDQEQIQGYVALSEQISNGVGLLNTVVVQPSLRQRGVGRKLVERAKEWGDARRLRQLLLETQTKNVPAVRFFQHCGFTFCGYNDHYYPKGDIAIFFYCSLGKAT